MVTITEKEFKLLASYIEFNYGIHLKNQKQSLVTGRLNNVLQEAGFNNFTDYYNYIVSGVSVESIMTLVEKITTNHTFFMREAEHFYYFRDNVLPMFTRTLRDRDLRVWCAACSSGEESYTLAMLIDEFFGKDKLWWDTKVLATDISEKVLTIAKDGIYTNERIDPLPATWKLKHFSKHDNKSSIISDAIKKEIIYRKFNLMDKSFPFMKKFHTIFCRNVMIYFDENTKTELVNKFYDSMEYGGYLFIGHSESLNREKTRFRFIMPSVYRKE